MNAFEGLNDEIRELITTLDKSDISTIKNYLSDKDLSEKYISALKTECNNMVASEALFYLLGTAQNQLFITKKVKGIMGLATLLNVSVKTVQKLKNSGIIDQAGKTAQIDHPFSDEIDHLFRSKLTTYFRSKLTT